jgi:hypothetical protein
MVQQSFTWEPSDDPEFSDLDISFISIVEEEGYTVVDEGDTDIESLEDIDPLEESDSDNDNQHEFEVEESAAVHAFVSLSDAFWGLYETNDVLIDFDHDDASFE